jgi:hypothetical protein
MHFCNVPNYHFSKPLHEDDMQSYGGGLTELHSHLQGQGLPRRRYLEVGPAWDRQYEARRVFRVRGLWLGLPVAEVASVGPAQVSLHRRVRSKDLQRLPSWKYKGRWACQRHRPGGGCARGLLGSIERDCLRGR